MTNDDTVSRPALPVARFLAAKQAELSMDDGDVASAVNLPQNSIRMIKDGRMKLPVGAIRALAHRLDVPPQHLLHVVLADYMPDLYAVMQQLRTPLELTKNERELLAKYRHLCEGRDALPVVVSGITLVFPRSV